MSELNSLYMPENRKYDKVKSDSPLSFYHTVGASQIRSDGHRNVLNQHNANNIHNINNINNMNSLNGINLMNNGNNLTNMGNLEVMSGMNNLCGQDGSQVPNMNGSNSYNSLGLTNMQNLNSMPSEPDIPSEMQLPGSEFDSDYPEMDNKMMNVEALSIAQGMSDTFAPAVEHSSYFPRPQYSRMTYNLPSDPPVALDHDDYFDSNKFDDIPSSPPSSPARHPPIYKAIRGGAIERHGRVPANLGMRQQGIRSDSHLPISRGQINPHSESSYNSLGITPNLIPNESLRSYRAPNDYSEPSNITGMTPAFSINDAYDSSPYDMATVRPPQFIEPRMTSPLPSRVDTQTTPHSGHLSSMGSMGSMGMLAPASSSIPDLSPALSDIHTPSSPSQEGFQWQPILTVPRSEQSEAIIEQQRKPKQKRKSCLPEGVVEEYVGYTETEGTYICLYPNCLRLFKRTYNLRSHIQTHLCDRPYVCTICEANFVRPHDLRRHERCHTDDRPFVCPCGKGFNRQDAMQRHRMRDICKGSLTKVAKDAKSEKSSRGKKSGSQPVTPKQEELDLH